MKIEIETDLDEKELLLIVFNSLTEKIVRGELDLLSRKEAIIKEQSERWQLYYASVLVKADSKLNKVKKARDSIEKLLSKY